MSLHMDVKLRKVGNSFVVTIDIKLEQFTNNTMQIEIIEKS